VCPALDARVRTHLTQGDRRALGVLGPWHGLRRPRVAASGLRVLSTGSDAC